jgi:integrase
MIQGYMSRKLLDGLSPRTVAYHRTVLREALAHAVRWNLLVRNPADQTSPPRVVRKEMHVLDDEQARLFVAEARRSSQYATLYTAALLTGARQGELLGLRWAVVNLTVGVASITRTFYRLSGKMLFKEPKSPKARRSIALPQALIEELQMLRAAQEQHRRLTGDCPAGQNCRDAG